MQTHEEDLNETTNSPTDQGDHRGKGKIARLPSAVRNQVNTMILDGVSYPEIRRKLIEAGHSEFEDISEKNISTWKTAGYQHWLREREWREEMQQSRAEALEFIGAEDDKLEQVTLKTASMRLYQVFKHFDAVDFSASVEKKPEAYTRLFSVLPRISREALRYQKYRDACVQARAEVKKLYDPNRKLTDSERRAIVRHVDDILGIRMPEPEPPPNLEPEPAPIP
jgi:hypothetical protein